MHRIMLGGGIFLLMAGFHATTAMSLENGNNSGRALTLFLHHSLLLGVTLKKDADKS